MEQWSLVLKLSLVTCDDAGILLLQTIKWQLEERVAMLAQELEASNVARQQVCAHIQFLEMHCSVSEECVEISHHVVHDVVACTYAPAPSSRTHFDHAHCPTRGCACYVLYCMVAHKRIWAVCWFLADRDGSTC